MSIKTIGYKTAKTAKMKFDTFFKGRLDCRFFEVTQDDFDEDDNFGPGGYIEGPSEIIDAWDAALKKIKLLRLKTGTTELVRKMMDDAETLAKQC